MLAKVCYSSPVLSKNTVDDNTVSNMTVLLIKVVWKLSYIILIVSYKQVKSVLNC